MKTKRAKGLGRIAVFVDETCLTEHGYRPRMVVEGEDGFREQGDDDWQTNPRARMPWFWGFDLSVAQQAADSQNEMMGISKAEALHIISESILASIKARGRRDGAK